MDEQEIQETLRNVTKQYTNCKHCSFCRITDVGETARYDCTGECPYPNNMTSPSWGRDCPSFKMLKETEDMINQTWSGKPYVEEEDLPVFKEQLPFAVYNNSEIMARCSLKEHAELILQEVKKCRKS